MMRKINYGLCVNYVFCDDEIEYRIAPTQKRGDQLKERIRIKIQQKLNLEPAYKYYSFIKKCGFISQNT
jgi:hypothetical protein